MKGCRWVREPISGLVQVAGFGLVCRKNEGEKAVVGANEIVAFGFDEKGAAIAADAGVNDGNVDGSLREVTPGLFKEECSLLDGVRRDFVCDIDYRSGGRNCGDDAFEDGYIMVGQAEIGE